MRKVSLMVTLLALTFLGAGCSYPPNAESNTAAISNLQSGPVYFMAGRIEAGQEAAISSRITARVNSVNVEVGARVEKGTPLIQLDSGDLSAQAAQARAGVEQAEASIDAARVSQENAQKTCDRYQELFKAGAISQAQLEQAQAELATADSALNTARAKLSQAQASWELASEQLSNSTLISPLAGVVSAKNINTGELAVSGAQLLKVVDADSLTINAYLPARLADRFKPGQVLVIQVSEAPEKLFKGRVGSLNPVLDSKNGDLLVKVQLTEPDPLLKPGMFAKIGLHDEGGGQ